MYEISNKAGVRGSFSKQSQPIQKKTQAIVQNAKRVDDIYKHDRNIKWRNGRMFAWKREVNRFSGKQ